MLIHILEGNLEPLLMWDYAPFTDGQCQWKQMWSNIILKRVNMTISKADMYLSRFSLGKVDPVCLHLAQAFKV